MFNIHTIAKSACDGIVLFPQGCRYHLRESGKTFSPSWWPGLQNVGLHVMVLRSPTLQMKDMVWKLPKISRLVSFSPSPQTVWWKDGWVETLISFFHAGFFFFSFCWSESLFVSEASFILSVQIGHMTHCHVVIKTTSVVLQLLFLSYTYQWNIIAIATEADTLERERAVWDTQIASVAIHNVDSQSF